ncbi:MAG: DUF1559 domain-containing protein, partial [Planctomycetota bacterium]
MHTCAIGCPRRLSTLVDRMLHKSPDKRPQTPAAINDALSAFALPDDRPLQQLVQLAMLKPDTEDHPTTSRAVQRAAPQSQSWFRHPVPRWLTIATGFSGFLLGLLLGVVLIIRYPDGTTLKLPIAGAQVEMVRDDSAGVDGPSNAKANIGNLPSETPAPQEIAPLDETKVAGVAPTAANAITPVDPANRPRWANEILETGDLRPTLLSKFAPDFKTELAKDPTYEVPLHFAIAFPSVSADDLSQMAKTAKGSADLDSDEMDSFLNRCIKASAVWLPMNPDVTVAHETLHRGSRLGLVYKSPSLSLPWSQIKGNIISLQSSGSGIQIMFTEDVGERLETLTGDNLNAKLCVISQGRIIMAPNILSKIGSRTSLAGIQTGADRMRLYQLLESGLKDDDGTARRHFGMAPMNAGPRTAVEAQIADRDKATRNQLIKIGIALHNYESAYRHFPGNDPMPMPNGLQPAEDAPQVSWRVKLLPFMEQQELYNRYRMNEPWDSEHNQQLLREIPSVFRIAGAGTGGNKFKTKKLALISDDSVMSTPGGCSLALVRDGLSNTAMIAECNYAVPWTKPEDAPPLIPPRGVSTVSTFVFPGSVPENTVAHSLGSTPDGFYWFLFGDGAARMIFAPDLTPQLFHSVVSKSGAEVV